MDGIRLRRDLADLPEPRFLHVTPAWLRGFAAVLAALLAVGGGWLFYAEASAPEAISWPWFGGGLAALAAGGFAFQHVASGDWRDWIDFAATEGGLYLPGRRKGVIFIPWPDVAGIAVVRPPWFDGRLNRLKLTLRLPAECWNGFSRFAPIRGEGAERSYTIPAVAASGEDLAAGIMSVRSRCASRPPLASQG